MDREKMRKQAQVLRNKKLAKRLQLPPVQIKNGVVKISNATPASKPKDASDLAPPSQSEIRRSRAASIYKKHQQLVNQSKQSNRGCKGCRRKG